MKKQLLFIVLCALSPILWAQETVVDTFMHEGLERNYRLYIPDLYTGETAVPLVINMHGRGSDALQQEFYSSFNNVADTANCLVVYPNGIDNLWNASFVDTPNDVGFLSTLIDRIINDYEIDENRIYSTGMSMGGFMSYSLACELSHRIAAIGSVTGSMGNGLFNNCEPQRPVPILQIHGTHDQTVPIEGAVGQFKSIDEVMAFWRERNGCAAEVVVTTDFPDIDTGDETTVSRLVYPACNETAEVILYTIENGDHTWPGALHLPFLGTTTNQDIHASAEIWTFFNRHGLNGLLSSTANTAVSSVASSLIQVQQNPFSDQLYLQINAPNLTNLTLYDSKGQQMMQRKEQYQANLTLSTAHLADGIYFLQALDAQGKTQTIKVIKQ